MTDSRRAAEAGPKDPAMTDLQLRQMVRKIAAQTTGVSYLLQDPWVQERAALSVTLQTSAKDIAGTFLAAANRRYLEPAAMLLWLLDQALDPRRKGDQFAREILRWLAKRQGPLPALSGDELTEEIYAAVAAAELQEALEDPAGAELTEKYLDLARAIESRVVHQATDLRKR